MPLKGNRCTADKCKKAYSAQRKASSDCASAVGSDTGKADKSKSASATSALKVQRTCEQVSAPLCLPNLARLASSQKADLFAFLCFGVAGERRTECYVPRGSRDLRGQVCLLWAALACALMYLALS